MTDLREAAEAALQALEHSTTHGSLTGAEWVFEEVEAAITALREALANPDVPEGWKLVPVEPTPEMLEAASHCWMMTDDNAAGYWSEMLAAAPQPKDTP